ncbi:hypothetical protein HDU82_005222 [Entophlyctis luteolus]|nr:hypothetical protein HDU82_005222 [Entophlyctis luteolus]
MHNHISDDAVAEMATHSSAPLDIPGSVSADNGDSTDDNTDILKIAPPRKSTPYSASGIVERVNLRHRNLPARSRSPERSQATSSGTETKDAPKETDEKEDGGMYECNICLDMASNAVVTLCGHLFCWPCISRWMSSNTAMSHTCPVCKAGIDREKLIPIYAKGRNDDPRNAVPEERPSGQRTEAAPQNRFGNFGAGFGGAPLFGGIFPAAQFNVGGTNVHFSAGFGPFGVMFPFFVMLGNLIIRAAAGGAANGNANPDAAIAQVVAQQAFISRIFMLIAALVFVAIVLY